MTKKLYSGANLITMTARKRELFRKKSEASTIPVIKWWYDMRSYRAAKKVVRYQKQLGW